MDVAIGITYEHVGAWFARWTHRDSAEMHAYRFGRVGGEAISLPRKR